MSHLGGWIRFAIVSLIFFQITAATFTSLGVVLPYMIEEMAWTWSVAGLGFSVLAFMVGAASRIPSWTLSRYGAARTFAIGGVIMIVGFILLATTKGLYQFYGGAALAGLGYTLCALVPGVAVINQHLPHRRSFAIGAYMMIGGLGGVAGPQFVTAIVAVTNSWRMHWWFMALSVGCLALIAFVVLYRDKPYADDEGLSEVSEKHSPRVFVTDVDWRFSDVLRTPQFYVIVAAMTMTLFSEVTTNSWAVAHMGNLGIAISIAAGALSAHALVNATSRVLGGILATRIDPKWLLAAALVAEVVGMFALASAKTPLAVTLFAIGEGFGFGMCTFATTVLLVNYYGPREAPKTIGTMYLISTIAMLGPVLGGYVADTVGSFAAVFQVYGVLLALCALMTIFMRPPRPRQIQQR